MPHHLQQAFLTGTFPQPLAKNIPLLDYSTFELFERLVRSDPCPVLLESGRGPEDGQRYSIIGSDPALIFRATGSRLEWLERNGRTTARDGDPLLALRDLFCSLTIPRPAGCPPFCGGAVGYFGYDLVHWFEKVPRLKPDDLALPDLQLAFFERVAVIDHQERRLWLLFTPFKSRFLKEPRLRLYEEGLAALAELEARANAAVPEAGFSPSCADPVRITGRMDRKTYEQRVERCLAYIAAGDIYQANLSHRFSIDVAGRSARSIYRDLRRINPSPFAALLEFPDMSLIGSSPERLVRLTGDIVETRPIAGTCPRGTTLDEDRHLSKGLLLSEKERAEHLMLVDLERNDLGRVCVYGTVDVDEFMTVERYSHVSHIVSNIRGRLAPGRDALDLLQAVFPGGTVTGVPKVRCMEILEELEPVRRGPYSGSIGYFSPSGDLDLNITIRTLVMKNRMAYLHVGAGIVADSNPAREYQETLYKAEALFQALELSR
jgi:para-aminobenzoate synthetase component 1